MSTAIIELDAEFQQSNDPSLADTPTHTSDTVSDPGLEGHFSVTQGMESVPWPGRTYMIRNRATDCILAREHGHLALKEAADLATCGWRWACVEHHEGWLGFRETSSGVYLGRDNQGGFPSLGYRTQELGEVRHKDAPRWRLPVVDDHLVASEADGCRHEDPTRRRTRRDWRRGWCSCAVGFYARLSSFDAILCSQNGQFLAVQTIPAL